MEIKEWFNICYIEMFYLEQLQKKNGRIVNSIGLVHQKLVEHLYEGASHLNKNVAKRILTLT